MIKIKDSKNLYRDINSKAIINCSNHEYEQAKNSKMKRLELEKRINSLENKLDSIIEILREK